MKTGPCDKHGWRGAGPCLDCSTDNAVLGVARRALRRDILRGLLANPEVFRGLVLDPDKTLASLTSSIERVTEALDPMLRKEIP